MRCLIPLFSSSSCSARLPEGQVAPQPPKRPDSNAPAPPPPLAAPALLVVVVDQLGSWVFETRRASLGPDGALAKLAREGIYARELRY